MTHENDADRFEVGNLTVRIEYDTDPESPREWDNLGTMVCWHRNYRLGDGKPDCDSSDFNPNEYAVCLPLYLYDHSGITMSTGPFSCPWDSGQVGWIYVTREKLAKEYGWKRLTKKRLATAAKYLTGEVETYDQYLTGQVYGFVVEDTDGNHLDSCWGFYGLEDCKAEGKASAEHWIKENAKTDKLLIA